MRRHLRKPGFVLVMSAMMLGVLVAPAGAVPEAKNTQIGGSGFAEWGNGVFDAAGDPIEYSAADHACAPLADPGPFADYDDFTMRLDTGDLVGCWYTDADFDNAVFNEKSGTYKEHGVEVFVEDGTGAMFETTYTFSGKFDLTTGAEIHGRCQHPIVAGSGTDRFLGTTGRVDFKDDVTTGTVHYRGHIKLANGA